MPNVRMQASSLSASLHIAYTWAMVTKKYESHIAQRQMTPTSWPIVQSEFARISPSRAAAGYQSESGFSCAAVPLEPNFCVPIC